MPGPRSTIAALLVVLQPSALYAQANTTETDVVPVLQTPLHLEVTGKRTPTRGGKDPTLASETLPVNASHGGQTSLAAAVSASPAVQTRKSGANASGEQIMIRGAGPRHTEAYVEGIPLDGGSGRGYQTVALPAPMLANVELYEGANPFGYGSAPIGGALHLNTLRPQAGMYKGWLGAGSFGSLDLGGLATLVRSRSRMLGAIALGGTRGDFAYLDDRGTVTNPDDDLQRLRSNNWRETTNGLWQWRHATDGGELSALGLYNGSRGGVAGSGTRQRTSATYQRQHFLGGAQYHHAFTHTVVQAIDSSVYYNFFQDALDDPRAEFGFHSRRSRDRSHLAGARYNLRLQASPYVQVQQHTEVRSESFVPWDRTTDSARGPTSQRTLLQPGVQLGLLPLEQLQLYQTLALQHVRGRVATDDGFGRWQQPAGTRHNTYPVYRSGFQLQPHAALAFRANYIKAYRIPSFTEMFGDGVYVQPAKDLQPEQADTVDGEIRYQWLDAPGQQWLVLKSGGHYSRIENIIQYVRSSADTFRAINLDEARIWGLTNSIGADLFDHVQATLNHQYLSTRQTSPSLSRNDKMLPMRPQSSWHGFVSLYSTLRTRKDWLKRVALDTRVQAMSGSWLDPANLIHIAARYTLDAGAELQLFGRQLLLRFDARNLTNQFYLDRAGFPQPGRNFYALCTYTTRP